MEAIKICQLCKTFKGKKKALIHALKNLELTVYAGEIFGFIGPNGAGKTTTIKILTGQIRPTSGTAHIAGIPVVNSLARENIGYLPENPSFYHFLTAREYLHFVGQIFKMSSSERSYQVNRVLELIDLVQSADRPIKGFSKGMIQRLGLAQALLHNPTLYILDEPMSGLDPVGRALVKDIILSLKQQGKTIFFSTHIISDVEAVCDRVGIIVGGELNTIENVMVDEELYTIQMQNISGDQETLVVENGQLNTTIFRIMTQGAIIKRIEPQSNNIEKLFLNIVSPQKG